MKRLFYSISIICLPLIAFFMFDNYRRHHPEAVYAYTPSQEIDPHYHDPDALLRYHQLCEEIGSYGRYCWREEKVDVLREASTDGEAGVMVQRYQSLIAAARYLEGKLVQSQKWKAEGHDNDKIRQLEVGGDSFGERLALSKALVQPGEESPLVLSIQQKLIQKGYTLQVDGIFREETQRIIKQYQQDKGLEASGTLD
ncbi:MAG: peptidoglycan-binding domain-containing protein, partial [Bacteroidota bacterium]